MRLPRSQTGARLRFGHNSFYDTCLHETRTKIAQTGLTSSQPLDHVQTGMNVNTNSMDRLPKRRIFQKSRNSTIHNNSVKECKVCDGNVVKCARYDPIKFANFVYFSITHAKLIAFSRQGYQFCMRNTKIYKICEHAGEYFSHFTTFRSQTLHFY
jgi:hypothetical protein